MKYRLVQHSIEKSKEIAVLGAYLFVYFSFPSIFGFVVIWLGSGSFSHIFHLDELWSRSLKKLFKFGSKKKSKMKTLSVASIFSQETFLFLFYWKKTHLIHVVVTLVLVRFVSQLNNDKTCMNLLLILLVLADLIENEKYLKTEQSTELFISK